MLSYLILKDVVVVRMPSVELLVEQHKNDSFVFQPCQNTSCIDLTVRDLVV